MEKGMPFEKFVLQCARAFGACIEVRDDPMDAPIPDSFPVSDYHVTAQTGAVAELTRLESMSESERIAYGKTRKAEMLECYERGLEKDRAENARLEEMERQVLGWTPPSEDHVELKEFMLQQINVSKNKVSYYEERVAEIRAKTPMDYYAEAVSEAKRGIKYHAGEHAKDVERNAGRNEWVRLLRDSLKQQPANAQPV